MLIISIDYCEDIVQTRSVAIKFCFFAGSHFGHQDLVRDPIPAPNLGEGIPLPIFQFWCGDDRFSKNSTLKWCGDRPCGSSKGVIPCSCNLALGGVSWYLCVLGLSACTALQEWGLARGCPPCLRRCRLPATSKIGEGSLPRFDI